jgi:hypothetical protein
MGKSRGTTVNSYTVVQLSDELGGVFFKGADGDELLNAAGIRAFVEGTPANGSVLARLSFQTGGLVEAMRLDSNGEAFFPLIATTASAANAFLDSGSTPANQLLRSTSSVRYKQDLRDLTDGEIAEVLQFRPLTYRSLARADDPNRRFFGFTAEDVVGVNRALVNFDEVGRPDGVQYERIVVPLVAMVQRLRSEIDELKGKMAR